MPGSQSGSNDVARLEKLRRARPPGHVAHRFVNGLGKRCSQCARVTRVVPEEFEKLSRVVTALAQRRALAFIRDVIVGECVRGQADRSNQVVLVLLDLTCQRIGRVLRPGDPHTLHVECVERFSLRREAGDVILVLVGRDQDVEPSPGFRDNVLNDVRHPHIGFLRTESSTINEHVYRVVFGHEERDQKTVPQPLAVHPDPNPRCRAR